MDSNLKSILEEFDKHKGQCVITDPTHEVLRLLAIAEDDSDYYYVFWDGKKTIWHSCLCGFIPLKDNIKDEDYNRILRIVKLNHIDSADAWNVSGIDEIKRRQIEIYDVKNKIGNACILNERYVTELCWDIN